MSGDKAAGREFHYIDKDGKRADHELHEPILQGVSEEADKAHRLESFHRAVEVHGIPAERAARLYGLEPEDVVIKPPRGIK
jgi:hypothetical protein